MSTRLCGVLILLAAMGCDFARAQDVPKGRAAFTEYVAELFRREMGGAAVVVKGPVRLAIEGMQANLDRIFGNCSQTATGCEREISNYVRHCAGQQGPYCATDQRDRPYNRSNSR